MSNSAQINSIPSTIFWGSPDGEVDKQGKFLFNCMILGRVLMGIKEDYENAVALTKKGRYVEARNLLMVHDHPKTNRLLERIDTAIANDKQAPKAKNKNEKTAWEKLGSKQKSQGIGCLVLLGLCGVISLFSMLSPSPGKQFEDGTLEGEARASVAEIFGSEQANEIETVVVNDIVVTLRFPLSDLSAWAARTEAENQLPKLVCELRERGLTGRTYQITGTISVVNALGNTSRAEGVETIIRPEIINAINCENADQYLVNLSAIAERYDVNPLIQGN